MPRWLGCWVLLAALGLTVLQGCQWLTGPARTSTASACGVSVAVSPAEQQLYQLLNRYRQARGLHAIRLSTSLAHVARSHALDLHAHEPRGHCGLHSWSRSGPWSACCYTLDHALSQCMWSKPRELTQYRGYGYEIAALYRGRKGQGITPRMALRILQESREHNAVILNQGPWARFPWESVGVGLQGLYAVIWFGDEPDPCGYF